MHNLDLRKRSPNLENEEQKNLSRKDNIIKK